MSAVIGSVSLPACLVPSADDIERVRGKTRAVDKSEGWYLNVSVDLETFMHDTDFVIILLGFALMFAILAFMGFITFLKLALFLLAFGTLFGFGALIIRAGRKGTAAKTRTRD